MFEGKPSGFPFECDHPPAGGESVGNENIFDTFGQTGK